MAKFIEAYTDTAETVFLRLDDIQRISFTKFDKSNNREIKVQFRDGSTGAYKANKREKDKFYPQCSCEDCGQTEE